ncbi:DUF3667 domain-containing protein [Ideonella paludis]|uniref:DUF3667 domain-containing protein n=1 Tax=Ideonella paludis TaxID=1233411 RepID=A0ABS5E311_9BURK|nr:DUF3667 domain-containing protein [Ideonella paludis]MBQ0937714.1 DUF3667 domain-containing protein [Ideonella paludis]
MSSSPSSTEVAHHGASDACLNCGAVLMPQAKFCHACGQDTANHPPSLFEFVHEFVAHYVALEGALWRSLKGLAFKPGFLTVEYLAGRKARYVLPLRLLLTLGFIFFLLEKVWPDPEETAPTVISISASASAPAEIASAAASAAAVAVAAAKPLANASAASKSLEVEEPEEPLGTRGFISNVDQFPVWLQPKVAAAKARWDKDPEAENARLRNKVLSLMPYAVLCSLPFFSGILALVFWRRRSTYGAHFVFAMHLHAFFYLSLIVLGAVSLEWLSTLITLWVLVYPLLAIKRTYALRWPAAIGCSGVVAVLHAMLLVVMVISVFLLGALAP